MVFIFGILPPLGLQDVSAISGSISIACWLFVSPPQIIENFRRRSAEGLSVAFIGIWLAADVFNILGTIIQGLLPTMIILALYFGTVDALLLSQVLYYKSSARRHKEQFSKVGIDEERSLQQQLPRLNELTDDANQTSPLLTPSLKASDQGYFVKDSVSRALPGRSWRNMTLTDLGTLFWSTMINIVAILCVMMLGVTGWYLFTPHTRSSPAPEPIKFAPTGQIFGYLGAIMYISARLPQLVRNHRRQSTEGVSLLFFLFALTGNVTYLMSILIRGPDPVNSYSRYLAVNASWIIGSAGSLLLDSSIFLQFFIHGDSAATAASSARSHITAPK